MITDDQIKLMIGSLLHDIGKVVYRSGDGRNHSQSGYEYLKNEAHISDDEILNCVRYHHGMYLKNASLAEDDKAYVCLLCRQCGSIFGSQRGGSRRRRI